MTPRLHVSTAPGPNRTLLGEERRAKGPGSWTKETFPRLSG